MRIIHLKILCIASFIASGMGNLVPAQAEPITSLQMAQTALNDARYQDAITLLEQLAQQPDNQNQTALLLAQTHILMGDDERALELIEGSLEVTPNDTHEHYIAGEIYCYRAQRSPMFKALKYAKLCATHFGQAVDADTSNRRALVQAASFFLSAPGIAGGDNAKGLAYLQQLKQLSPEHYAVFLATYPEPNKISELGLEAVELPQQLVFAENQYRLGRYYRESGRLKEAKALMYSFLEAPTSFDDRPIYIDGHFQMGEILRAQGDNIEAITYLEKHLDLLMDKKDFSYFWSLWGLAKAYYENQQLDQFSYYVGRIQSEDYKSDKVFKKEFEAEYRELTKAL